MNGSLILAAKDSTNIVEQGKALSEIVELYRGTRDERAIHVLCEVAMDGAANVDIRWLAYVFALEVDNTPLEDLPKLNPYCGFFVPEHFDMSFIERGKDGMSLNRD